MLLRKDDPIWPLNGVIKDVQDRKAQGIDEFSKLGIVVIVALPDAFDFIYELAVDRIKILG